MNSRETMFYTDGACSGNPGIGGWAYAEIIYCDKGLETHMVTGNNPKTTNNEMELTAVYMALVKAYKSKQNKVTIYSDSAYVVNAITKGWLLNWSKNDWKTKENKPIKNKLIWEKMYKLIYVKKLDVTFIKVKGHEHDIFNQLVDRYAVEAKKKLQ